MAVIGGRGWLGRAIVRAARHRGLALTVVSRTPAAGVVVADPTDTTSLARACARADVVVNAAGYRGPDPRVAVRTNFNLADSLRRLAMREGWRLVHVGSAAEYGRSARLAPHERIHEDRPCAPSTLYGLTKLAGARAVQRAWADGADALVARVFNVAAADVPPDNPVHDIAAQVRQVARTGGRGPVAIGDPTTVRDISRRSWIAAAIVALAMARPEAVARHPVVNVCSGEPIAFGDLAQAMARHLDVQVTVRDLGWPRGGRIVGDPTRLRSLVDLPPTNPAEDLARSILGPSTSLPVLAGDPR